MEPVQPQRFEPACAPEMAVPGDRELLRRFIERRDERAFEALVQAHGPLVLGVCRRVIGNHHDAEEAFQATFMVLARKASSVRPPEMVANWLYGVACRTSLKMRTAIAQRRAKEVQVTMVPEPKAPQSDRWEDIAPLLDRELSRLPDKYRAAVVSCDIEGRSRSDAARQLGWPEGTLKVRLMQARSILAKRLARQGVVLSVGALAAIVSQNAASAAVPATLMTSTAKAAGALAATHAVSTTAIGTKGAALAKGMLKSLLLSKAAVATTVAGFTVAAAMLATTALNSTPQKPTKKLKLPAGVQRALEENAQFVSPIGVTCTTRIESRLSHEETLERLHMTGAARPDRLFEERPYRVVWQDQKFYIWNKFHAGEIGDLKSAGFTEITFDGRVYSVGSVFERPKELNVVAQGMAAKSPQKSRPNGAGINSGSLTKEPVAKALRQPVPGGLGATMPYFRPEIGLVFPPDSHGIFEGGRIVEQKLRSESAILDFAGRGGELISIENVPLEGKPCLRIELEAPNPLRRLAETIDREKMRRDLKMSRETPKWQEEIVRKTDEMAKLPETRRYVYFLDPELHYAVRRCEQRYGADTLLSRTDCSQFEQIPGRQLWLPRRVEEQLHEYPTVPGTVFKEAFLTQIAEVSAFDGNRVPDETFRLDYTAPGTMIRDGTVPATAQSKDGYVSYMVPPRTEDLAGVLERAHGGENISQLGSGLPLATEPPVASQRGSALLAIVLCNVTLLGAGAAYVVWRRRKGGAL
jgi:RNA polymerase sigma factor (sigma-70 family)